MTGRRVSRRSLLLLVFLLAPTVRFACAADAETLLLRAPAISASRIAFVYAGDIWTCPREGGEATRLTAGPAPESNPVFSPDGALIAFSGRDSGNADVYVVPATGGIPRRLTWHPGDDIVRGFTPDGASVLFSSGRAASSDRYDQLFTVPVKGGLPVPLPLPMAERGAFAADGRRIAYTPLNDTLLTWRGYRGGMTTPIRIYDAASGHTTTVPHGNATDTSPAWSGNTLYFISDRAGLANVFAWDPATNTVREITHHDDAAVRSISSGGGLLVYEQGERLHLLDPATGSSRPLAIHVGADLPAAHPQMKRVAHEIQSFAISPTGSRILLEAHGEILNVPAGRGSARNLTRTPGAAERWPAWSPDGQRVLYFSDASGEYELVVRDQAGLGPPRVIPIDVGGPSFYYDPRWSPDGERIAYTDKRLQLWIVDLKDPKPLRVDTDTFDHPERSLDPDWSPDGRFLAYTKRLANHLRAVFVYDVATAGTHQVTNGTRDTISARFSPDGKYLFFAASSNYALNTGWLEMSSFERPVRRILQVAILARGGASPLARDTDDEPAGAARRSPDRSGTSRGAGRMAVQGSSVGPTPPGPPPGPREPSRSARRKGPHKGKPSTSHAAEAGHEGSVDIDFDGLAQRVLALPVEEGDFSDLRPGTDGALFYVDGADEELGGTLRRYVLGERQDEAFLDGVLAYRLSDDGSRLLIREKDDAFSVIAADAPPEGGFEPLKLDDLEVRTEPVLEWRQIFEESGRFLRDYFYDPTMHGLDWPAVRARYRALLPYIGHRSDLTYILAEMGGELGAGHYFVDDPEPAEQQGNGVGLLGADFAQDGGRYRVARVFREPAADGDPPPPLAVPGTIVEEGEFLLAVNGESLAAPDSPYRLLDGTAGRATVLTVARSADGTDARHVTVVPIEDETGLRHRAWTAANRARVDRLSGGRVAYVYLPDTGTGGYDAFNRDYFSQLDRQAVVLDDRFNSGGALADYIIDLLGRTPLAWWATREGALFSSPLGAIFGPRAMIVNEYSASGGDAIAQFFRRRGLGPIVGRRTWGGLIAIYDVPVLLDGGTITVPRAAILSPEGRWEVENEGVAPDIDVDVLPEDVAAGRDPQLERAVETVLAELARHPLQVPSRPAPRLPFVSSK